MHDLSTTTILPPWVIAPVFVIAMLALAAHVSALGHAAMPESRRRIRKASGILMLFTTPLLAYLFGGVSPAEAAVFVIGWTTATVLVFFVLLLGLLDMLNTVRLYRLRIRELRRESFDGVSDARAASSDQA